VSVQTACDPHLSRETPWTVEARPRLPALKPDRWLPGAYENRVTVPGAMTRHVEAVVHSVNEKHVRMTFFAQENARALGQTGTRVTRKVARAPVCLGFHDARHEASTAATRLVHKNTSDKTASYRNRFSRVPCPRQACGAKGGGGKVPKTRGVVLEMHGC
jgi:hypothetical protein